MGLVRKERQTGVSLSCGSCPHPHPPAGPSTKQKKTPWVNVMEAGPRQASLAGKVGYFPPNPGGKPTCERVVDIGRGGSWRTSKGGLEGTQSS